LHGVILDIYSYSSSWVKLSITAEDKDWSLDYILFRNDDEIANFTHPNYYGSESIWMDTGVNPATVYWYNIVQTDRLNRFTSPSETVYVCTDPPTPGSVNYTIDMDSMVAEITWIIPSVVYSLNISVEITTDSDNTHPLHTATSPPFTWPETLSLRDHYQFYVRFVIHCGLSNYISKYQYSSWASISVKASVPELTVTQRDKTTAAINVSKYEEFYNLRLFMDGVEYVPAPSLYPHNITGLNPGKTYTFHVQAEQFGEAIQSPVVTIKGTGGVDLSISEASTNAKIGAVIGSVGAGVVLVFLIVLSVIAVLWSRHICTFQFSLVSKRAKKNESRPHSSCSPTDTFGGSANKFGGNNYDQHNKSTNNDTLDTCSTESDKVGRPSYSEPSAGSHPQSRSGTILLSGYVRDSSGGLVSKSVLLNESGVDP
ncbi:uncharacterized protein LOC142355873, partial [Convolutriloba macropyga]|uniref:uncharacterized protein LOC142355873 n=1 Tax=Convolutriloba macropyga TaxID=536237 RepID=UPI003F51D717